MNENDKNLVEKYGNEKQDLNAAVKKVIATKKPVRTTKGKGKKKS